MPCIPKSDIKARFKTGEKPTQQDFANLIDSFVETVNGIEPDIKGNVNIPDTSQKVQSNLEEHKKVVATSTVAGHIKVQNTIDDNTTNALTPSAVKSAIDTIESAEKLQNENIVNIQTGVEALQVSVKTNTDDIAALKTGGSGSPEDPTLSSKVTQNTNDIKDLEDTTASQALALNALDASQNVQDADIATLKTKVDNLTTNDDITDLKVSVKTNTDDIKTLKSDVDNANNALTVTIPAVIHTVSQVSDQVDANTLDITGIKSSVKTNTDDIKILKDANTDIAYLTESVETNTDDIKQLKTDVSNNNDLIKVNQKVLGEHSVSLGTANSSIKTNTDDIATLKSQNTDLTASVKTNTDNIGNLQADNVVNGIKMDTMSNNIGNLTNMMTDLQQAVQALQNK